MNPNDLRIKDILFKEAYVTPEDLQKAEEYAIKSERGLVHALLTLKIINKPLLGQAIAEVYGLPFANLDTNQPSVEDIKKIRQDVAQTYKLVVYQDTPEQVKVATSDPSNPQLKTVLSQIFSGRETKLAWTFQEDIEKQFVHYRDSLFVRLNELIKSQSTVAPNIIQEIFHEASINKASDIHFEPQADVVIVRFRIDGVLTEATRIAKPLYDNILNKIKIQAKLRIDEHDSPQDGAIRYVSPEFSLDFRISIIPTLNGEKIAMRILSQYVRDLNLSELGISALDQEKLLAASKKPFGMILTTGPTGSGKSTTLYALLRTLNRPEVNITTIEDPVEYKLTGANQIQVNQQTNLTFATGLRSIIRQDPNIILVGEIRDLETAEIAVNAALTGHLLLSTFHANDSATAIPRLLDMGVEPFLLASTLELIMSQRLLRKICDRCKFSQTYMKSDLVKSYPAAAPYFTVENMTFYKGKGCSSCGGTGYKGRIGIYELIQITPALQDMFLKNPSAKQIWEQARKEGARTLFEDGWEKAKSGVTTIEELLRVAKPQE